MNLKSFVSAGQPIKMMTPELQQIVDALREKIRAMHPNNPRNDVPAFATGVE